jgi:ParB family chromosome partitioning protein
VKDVTTRARLRRGTQGTRPSSEVPEYADIPLGEIEPDPALARWEIDPDKLSSLSQSLEEQAQVEAITVRRVSGRDKFLIICGERRWRAACQDPRARTIRCVIHDGLSDADALLMRLADYLMHEDFQLLELGELVTQVRKLLDVPLRRLARRLHVRLDRLRRPLAMLKLPPSVQGMVRSGTLKPSHAYEVSRVPEGSGWPSRSAWWDRA